MTQVTDPTGTYQFTFDNMGRLTQATTSYSFLTARNFAASYSYDAASNRTGFTDPESGATSYAYDTLNRLQTLTPPSAFSGTSSFGFTYDALSRRTQMTRPNGLKSIYAYDNLSRLLSVLHQSGSTTLDGASYTLDNAGNRTAKTDQLANVTSNFTYDPIYELTQVTQATTTTESYSYDAVGNRLSSLGVSSYTNNSSNELTSTSNTTYTYDYNGNTLTKVDSTGTTSYVWDFENRLTNVTLPGSGGTVTFAYDPFGRRIKKVTSSATSIYAFDRDNLIEETNSSGVVVARYEQTQNIDEPLAMLRSSATSYYHADGLGSISSLSNAAGSIANTYTYDSFGKLTASTGSLVNPFRYTARESDTETGLYYYRARYYDQQTGRFLSEDALGATSDDLDLYRYVHNSPAGYTDPSGHRTYNCGPKCGFRLETDPFKGKHINWWCNGLKGCLLFPSMRPCEESKSDPPPSRLRKCVDDNLPKPKPKSCPKTDFEIQKDIESTQDMVNFWDWILVGDAAVGAVGVAGALGLLGGGAAGAGGAATAPKPIPFPKPAPPIPVPVKPAA